MVDRDGGGVYQKWEDCSTPLTGYDKGWMELRLMIQGTSPLLSIEKRFEMGTYNFAFLGRYDQDIASKPAWLY